MAKKRTAGEGTIIFRSGKWRGQITIDGQRLSHTSRRRDEVLNWIHDINEQIAGGLTYEGAKTFFGDYLTLWLARMGKLAELNSSPRMTTYKHYLSISKNYLKPSLGKVLVKDLSADQLQFTYNKWINDGVGISTIEKAHKIIHQVLRQAEITGLVQRNIASLVKSPHPPKIEMKTWTESEVNRFMLAARKDKYYVIFCLALGSGMRQMELLGLQWKDVRWSQNTIHVCRQLSRFGGQFLEPKTKNAVRSIELGEGIFGILKEYYQEQLQQRIRAGDEWQDQDLVFANEKGDPVKRTQVVNHFKSIVKAAVLPELRFHDLRHTAATIMLNQGIPPVIVAGRLGHKLDVLMKTYAHFIPSMQTEAARVMDEILLPITIPIKDRVK